MEDQMGLSEGSNYIARPSSAKRRFLRVQILRLGCPSAVGQSAFGRNAVSFPV